MSRARSASYISRPSPGHAVTNSTTNEPLKQRADDQAVEAEHRPERHRPGVPQCVARPATVRAPAPARTNGWSERRRDIDCDCSRSSVAASGSASASAGSGRCARDVGEPRRASRRRRRRRTSCRRPAASRSAPQARPAAAKRRAAASTAGASDSTRIARTPVPRRRLPV